MKSTLKLLFIFGLVQQFAVAEESADKSLDKHRDALFEIMNQVPGAAPPKPKEPAEPSPPTQPEKTEIVEVQKTPTEVHRDIVKTHSDAARETRKLLADPLSYEEAPNPDSAEIAASASVDDSASQTVEAVDVTYTEFLNVKELKKYKKFADKRIAIPVYRVAFTVQTKTSARSMAGLDNSRGSITTSMTVALAGITNETMQRITDHAYEDYLTRLIEAGFDVVPFDEIQQTSGYKQIKFIKGLYSKNILGTAFAVKTPTGMPLFWDFGNPIGNAGFGMGQPYNRISSETNSTVIIPTLVVNFAEMTSSGRSFLATSAKVGAEMGITLSKMTMHHLRIGDPRVSTAVKFMATPKLKETLSISGDFGEMLDGGQGYDDRALNGLLSMGMGTALSSRVAESRIVKADPGVYSTLALQALATGNAMFVGALADARDGIKPPKKRRR
ncbi:MAG: hypothetical protein HOE54_11760 [Gammaproteobacteria bacterium]|jgi:hypothetical protein|nr:hypothetical protein [Gammaproteobacteria bacterium]MBT7371991.1 hypothetical protein [Gammaproteobacteria bacterium]